MKKIKRIQFFLFAGYLFTPVVALAQNVAINTSGAAAASTNMFEVTQTSTAADMVAIYAIHNGATGAGLTGYGFKAIKTGATGINVAGYFSASGGASNYAIIVPSGGGFVGIGTASPTVNLDVNSTADDQPIIQAYSNNAVGINAAGVVRAKSDAANLAIISHGTARTAVRFGITLGSYNELVANGGNGLIVGALGAVPLIFGTNNLERMRILSGGNVGIGTTTPGSPLTVYGNSGGGASATQMLEVTNIGYVCGGCGTFYAAKFISNGATTSPSGGIYASATNGSSNYAAIFDQGNVGIGTTAPTSKLQVVGLPQYANNAAAIAGGLTVGAFYRDGGDPDHVCVVH